MICSSNSFSQLLDARHLINITSGIGKLSGNDNNLFIPSTIDDSGLNLNINYDRKINPWLAGGLSVGYYQFSGSTSSLGFAEVVSSGGTFISAGPQIIFHSPYHRIGLFNWLRLGIAITPPISILFRRTFIIN